MHQGCDHARLIPAHLPLHSPSTVHVSAVFNVHIVTTGDLTKQVILKVASFYQVINRCLQQKELSDIDKTEWG